MLFYVFITLALDFTERNTRESLLSLTGQSKSLPDLSVMNLSPDISIIIPPKYPLNSTRIPSFPSIKYSKNAVNTSSPISGKGIGNKCVNATK